MHGTITENIVKELILITGVQCTDSNRLPTTMLLLIQYACSFNVVQHFTGNR